jgi:hypothetical protein
MPDAQRIGVASLAEKESTENVKTEKEPNGH